MISDADRLEQDRKHMREFEAAIEDDLAFCRGMKRRFIFKIAAIGLSVIAVEEVIERLLHFRISVAFLVILVGIASGFAKIGIDSVRMQAADKLRSATAPRLAGILASYYTRHDPLLSDAARDGLRRCLPKITRSHSVLLAGAGLGSILRLLFRSTDSTILVPLLDAISRLGDPQALRDVRRFVGSPPNYMNVQPGSGAFVAVKQAADECVRVLEARDLEERARAMLLRPADSEAEDFRLLRPAAGAGTQPNLLRSSDQDEIGQTVQGTDS